MARRIIQPSKEKGHVCFVISPIGVDGTEVHRTFKEVFDFVIKPAIESSGYRLSLLRADHIDRPGSFINDILQQLLNSHIVIADLTDQNPNVFYELGVRHALSPRTILISQSIDDIPSDLREYRTILYDNTPRGVVEFKQRLHSFLKEIFENPHHPDNPVLDRLGSVLDGKTAALQEEVKSLRQQIDRLLKTGAPKSAKEQIAISVSEKVFTRVNRILNLENAIHEFLGEIEYGEDDEKRTARIPVSQGPFNLYFRLAKDGTIIQCWYVAVQRKLMLDSLLPEIRVLMGTAVNGGLETDCLFIIATNESCPEERREINDVFRAMKKFIPGPQRKLFDIDLWDDDRLTEVETQVGIRVRPPQRKTSRSNEQR